MMYRHPFANPEHIYGRASSPEYHIDRRAPTPGPGPYGYRSFMPMASQSSFFGDRPTSLSPGPAPGQGRAASLPEPRQPQFRYISDPRATWTEGFDDTQSETTRVRPAWKRVLQRMSRRARRGLQKVRAILHRDDRRSVSGFS